MTVVTKLDGLAPNRCQFTLDKLYCMVYASNIIKKEVIMKLGTKIIGNFGAMHPLWFGKIVKVDKKTKLMGDYAVDVKWSNGSGSKMMRGDLIPDKHGIGYMTEETYYGFFPIR